MFIVLATNTGGHGLRPIALCQTKQQADETVKEYAPNSPATVELSDSLLRETLHDWSKREWAANH